MDQARWMIVMVVIFCMLGVLTMLQRMSNRDHGPNLPKSGPEVSRVEPDARSDLPEAHKSPAVSFLKQDVEFHFGPVPDHCKGADDLSDVSRGHQALDRFEGAE